MTHHPFSILLILTVIGCGIGCKSQTKNEVSQKHTDHMGLRAIQTDGRCPFPSDDLGCKNGHLWKQVGYDDWVDIGPITDSCNCSRKELPMEQIHHPGDKPICYIVFAITDSNIFLPNGFASFVNYEDPLPKINHVPKDGMGVWSIGYFPNEIITGGFKITITKLDSPVGEMFSSGPAKISKP